MILAQIEEWFHSRPGRHPRRRAARSRYRDLVIDPKPVGDLTHVEGSYQTPYGVVSAEWTRRNGRFRLDVELPPNTTPRSGCPPAAARPKRPETAQCSGDCKATEPFASSAPGGTRSPPATQRRSATPNDLQRTVHARSGLSPIGRTNERQMGEP